MRAPARCIFRRGLATEIGRKSPLRKMTSAAFGAAGKLDHQRTRRGEPGQAFFAAAPVSVGLPGEEGLTPHPRPRGALLESGVVAGFGNSDHDRVGARRAVPVVRYQDSAITACRTQSHQTPNEHRWLRYLFSWDPPSIPSTGFVTYCRLGIWTEELGCNMTNRRFLCSTLAIKSLS